MFYNLHSFLLYFFPSFLPSFFSLPSFRPCLLVSFLPPLLPSSQIIWPWGGAHLLMNFLADIPHSHALLSSRACKHTKRPQLEALKSHDGVRSCSHTRQWNRRLSLIHCLVPRSFIPFSQTSQRQTLGALLSDEQLDYQLSVPVGLSFSFVLTVVLPFSVAIFLPVSLSLERDWHTLV